MTDFNEPIKNAISFSDFGEEKAEKIFQNVKENRTALVLKDQQPECVLISPEDYSETIEQYNDLLLLIEAIQRMQDKSPDDFFTQDQVNQMFGFSSEQIQG